MGRSPCCEKAHTNKGAWTREEDQRLVNYIRLHGEGCWRSLPKQAGLLRCGKSCRLRWINYLRPDLKRGNFTDDEDELIIKLHSLLGNKWSLIAARLPGRTDNEIKNYWNTHIKRKLVNRGLDPQTHRPIGAAAAPKSELKTTLETDPCSILPVPEANSISQTIDFKKGSYHDDSPAVEAGEPCNSGTTTEDAGAGEEIELELSIGLAPFRSITGQERRLLRPVFEFLPTTTGAPETKVGVCLCWQLGFEGGQMCSNCQTTGAVSVGGFYRCVGPLGS